MLCWAFTIVYTAFLYSHSANNGWALFSVQLPLLSMLHCIYLTTSSCCTVVTSVSTGHMWTSTAALQLDVLWSWSILTIEVALLSCTCTPSYKHSSATCSIWCYSCTTSYHRTSSCSGAVSRITWHKKIMSQLPDTRFSVCHLISRISVASDPASGARNQGIHYMYNTLWFRERRVWFRCA